MKIGVLGSGLMGKEAARDLVNSEQVTEVGLADLAFDQAKHVCDQLNSPKLTAYQVDASNDVELADYMRNFDVIINALFYSFNEKVAQTAIKVGVSSVDLGGHIGNITDKVLGMKEEAKKAGVTIIPDLGFAPGMINILSGYGASKLDEVESIRLFVGGIPAKPEPPLEYNHVFSMEGLFDHYTDPALIIRDGKKQEVKALTEVESIHFDEYGELEAFHTSGGTSTLPITFADVDTLEYKTIRYPGHAEKFKLLVDLNLTSKDAFVDIDGQKINTREVLLKALDPFVELGEKKDAVLLRVVVGGKKNGQKQYHQFQMTTTKDMENQVTAMARATANTISVVAQMIGSGVIEQQGVYPPEQIVPGKEYIEEMAKRDVVIQEATYEDESYVNV